MSDIPLPDDTREIFRMVRMETRNSIVALKSICILLRRDDCPVDKVLAIAHKSADYLETFWQELDSDLAERRERLNVPELTREERWLFSQPERPIVPRDYPDESFLQGFVLRYQQLTAKISDNVAKLQTESGRNDMERCILDLTECLEWANDSFR